MPELMTKQDAIEYLLYMKHDVQAESPMDIAIDTAIEALKQPTIEPEVQHGRWIPCSERLPENFVWCLVCMSDGCIRLGKWDGEYDEQGVWWVSHPNSGGKLYRIKNVPFWMLLPEPPKNEE